MGAILWLSLAPLGFPTAVAGPVLLAPDGGWSWFSNPRALALDGVIYFGYVRQGDGRVALSVYDPRRHSNSLLWLSDMRQRDDHDAPGLARLADGRLLAVYARHNTDKAFHYRLSSGTNPALSADWGPEQTSPEIPAGITYGNPFALADESRVFNFLRGLNFNPTFLISDRTATNWSAPRLLIKTGTGRARPYVQYWSDLRSRIDFVYTDGHPLACPTNSLYHAYYQAGGLYRSDGTLLKPLSEAPLLHDAGERGTLIYQARFAPTANPDDHIPGGRAWCWDLVAASNGAPVTVFSVQRTNVMGSTWVGDRIYYYYATWTGKDWRKRFIAQAGRPLYEGERDYAGGIALDPSNPNVVYLSSNAARPFDLGTTTNVPLAENGRYELYRGVSSEGGLSFVWEAVTHDSLKDNIRPYVPRHNPYPLAVLWLSGTYSGYTAWRTAVQALVRLRP